MILTAPPLAAIIWPDSPARFHSKSNDGSRYAEGMPPTGGSDQAEILNDAEP
jgi:hypothetical protein